MKTRKVISLIPGLCALALFAVSCTGDEMENTTGDEQVDPMNFSVSVEKSWSAPQPGWNKTNSEDGTRAANDISEQVLTLQGENPSDKLYMHLTVSDWDDKLSGSRQQSSTRAKPINPGEFEEPFGLFARIVLKGEEWDDFPTPNYLHNVKIKQQTDNRWRPDETIYWPGSSWKIRMMAYAPYNAEGISFNPDNVYTLMYETPDDVTKQVDLMFALSGTQPGNYNEIFTLQFQHILSAVKFTVDNIPAGRITEITLSDIWAAGEFELNPDFETDNKAGSWVQDYRKNFTIRPDFKTDGTSGGEITGLETTLMLLSGLRQYATAAIKIKFIDDSDPTGTERSYTASLSRTLWEMGKIYTYHISINPVSTP